MVYHIQKVAVVKNALVHLSVAAVITALSPTSILAVPVVPNFTQGSMSSHTETTSKVTETINSIDYATGWQYSVSGTNVDNGGQSLTPSQTTNSIIVNPLGGTEGQITSNNSGLSMSNQNFKITNPGAAFQFTQTYSGPGVSNQTVIQRLTEVTSVTDTTSIFTQ
jgi:hypothetical protein